MSAPPYMKLFVADYLGDTHHLTAIEHGAYLLLLMAMWRAGGSLPALDGNLARMARCTPEEWVAIRDVVLPFFTRSRGRLTQKRMATELAKYETISGKRSTAGKQGGRPKVNENNDDGKANALDDESNSRHNQNQNQEGEKESLLPPPVTGKKAKRRDETKIPDGYPDAAAIASGQDRLRAGNANVDAGLQAERFRNHADQTDRRCRDWAAAWRNWIAGVVERDGKAGAVQGLQVAPIAPWTGPAALRAKIADLTTEAFAASYVDTTTYDAERRLLIAVNAVYAAKLTGHDDVAAYLRRANVQAVTTEQSKQIRTPEGVGA